MHEHHTLLINRGSHMTNPCWLNEPQGKAKNTTDGVDLCKCRQRSEWWRVAYQCTASHLVHFLALLQVGEYSAQSLLLSHDHDDDQQAASVHRQPSRSARQLSGLVRKTTGGAPTAVQQMEAQLRATRQDALQLATAVVRLEKEKAVLQTQVSGDRSMVSMPACTLFCDDNPHPPPPFSPTPALPHPLPSPVIKY